MEWASGTARHVLRKLMQMRVQSESKNRTISPGQTESLMSKKQKRRKSKRCSRSKMTFGRRWRTKTRK